MRSVPLSYTSLEAFILDDVTVNSLSSWLGDVLELFNDIFFVLMGEPVFRFFIGVLVFVMLAGLLRYILWRGSRL